MNKLNRPEPAGNSYGGGAPSKGTTGGSAPLKGTTGGSAIKTGGGMKGAGGGNNPIDSMPIGGGGGGGYSNAYDDEGGNVNTVPCSKCGRNFGEDRIGKHEKTCKVNAKPKKVKMFHKPITEKEKAKMDAIKEKTSKWRQQHDDFVQAMKYNRKVSAVEARGGDVRNIAPPPPSSNVGLVQCPYCGRNFGEVQAGRHIPSCKNTVNKPKGPPVKSTPASYGGGYGGSTAAKKPAPTATTSKTSTMSSKPSGGAGFGVSKAGASLNPGAGDHYSNPYGGGIASNPRAPMKPTAGNGGGMGGASGGASNYRKKF